MKCFKSGGVKFYMLSPGESYPDPFANNEYVGAYVVFFHEGRWWAQIHELKVWRNLTDQTFDTENEAFNFAYEHYGKMLDRRYKLNC